MIVTRAWLGEFVDLKGISTDEICEALNSIGLEVDSVKSYKIPPKVVVGLVKSKIAHPNADKLSITQVDVGTSTRQIVCGARNVEAGQYVPVAMIGCKLSKDFKIKPTKLRGEQSDGMICSSLEIGLPQLNDGIMVLDDSLCELKLGEELCNSEILNDDIITIELTANRGDALSIYGVARDLSVKLKRNFDFKCKFKDNNKNGIGRFFKLSYDSKVQSKLAYKLADFNSSTPMELISFRLKAIDNYSKDTQTNIVNYLTHTTGVLFRAYNYDTLHNSTTGLSTIEIRHEGSGIDNSYDKDNNQLASIGIKSHINHEFKPDSKVIYEVSFIDADIVSQLVHEQSLPSDDHFYKSSRGSNSDLDFATTYLSWFLQNYFDADIYSGRSEYSKNSQDKRIYISVDKIEKIVGQRIEADTIVYILQNLGFRVDLNIDTGEASISVPAFRQDIKNIADIIEEIVRMVGIDKIKSKPLNFFEQNRITHSQIAYKKSRDIRYRAVANGFYESVSYVFGSKTLLEKYGFDTIKDELDLLNPINSDLDTLRSTMLLNLLQAVSNNKKSGYKKIELFEIGSVFDTNRKESKELTFVSSGYTQEDGVQNHGKPKLMDFDYFATKLSKVIGDFTLVQKEQITNRAIHPYQSANIVIDDEIVGYISKLHTIIQNDFDIADTFFAIIDFDRLKDELKTANSISKFQASTKDLTITIKSSTLYSTIRKFIESKRYDNVVKFYPLDIFTPKDSEEIINLTLRFVIQSHKKTLIEEDLTSIMSTITEDLTKEFVS